MHTYNHVLFLKFTHNYYALYTQTEYFVAILSHLQTVNNNPDVLPYHLLCITTDTSPHLPQILDIAYNSFVNIDTVPVVIDVLNSQVSDVLHSFLLPFSIPIVQFGFSHTLEKIEPDVLADVIIDPSKRLVKIDHDSMHKLLSRSAQKFLFAVGPEYISVYQTINGIAKQFGWARIGVVVASSGSMWESFTAQGVYTQ